MAHFAELDNNLEVLRVIVVSNEDVDANGGDQSSQAETFVSNLVPHSTGGASWKQTSYNNNFRKQYAAIGYLYNSFLDMFIVAEPYSSWSLDSDGDWKAPVTYPSVSEIGSLTVFPHWDEPNLKWIGSTWSDNIEGIGTEKKYTWDASNTQWNEV